MWDNTNTYKDWAELREKVFTIVGVVVGAIVFTGAVIGIIYLYMQRSVE